jgi:hypothetical protein
MVIVDGWRQCRDDVYAICDPVRVRDHLVVGACKQRIPCARTAKCVHGGVGKGRVRRHVEGEQGRKSSSEAVAANRHGADGARKRKLSQCVDHSRRIRRSTGPQGLIHGGETVFGVGGANQERAWHLMEFGVVNPFQDPFGTSDRDHHITGVIRLADQADGDFVVASTRVNVGRKIIGMDRCDRCVVRTTGADRLTGGIRQVAGQSVDVTFWSWPIFIAVITSIVGVAMVGAPFSELGFPYRFLYPPDRASRPSASGGPAAPASERAASWSVSRRSLSLRHTAVNPQSTVAVCGLSGLDRQTAGEMPISLDVRIFGWTSVWSAEWTDPQAACR